MANILVGKPTGKIYKPTKAQEEMQRKIDILVERGELIKHEEPEHGAIMYEDMGGHIFSETFAEEMVKELEKEHGKKYFDE